MNPQSRPQIVLLIFGVVVFFVFGSQLVIPIVQHRGYVWTPMTPIDESEDRVDVYIRDTRLVDLLDGESLVLNFDSEEVGLTTEDVTIRLNNYDRIRASKIPSIGFQSAMVMASLLVIAYVLTVCCRKREDEPKIGS